MVRGAAAGRRAAAWLAATLTAVSLPQIWFAKLSVPETVAQCFVMAGVLAWLVACARGATRWALAAGWFLGLACFAKVDLLVLLPVFLLAVVAARLLTRARFGDPPLLLALLAAFGLVVAHNFVHYLSFATHYRPYVAYLIQTSSVLTLLRDSALVQAGAALAAGLLAAAGVAALRRPAWRWPRWCWGWAAVAALVAYGVNYVTTTAGRLDETIVWLSWYVSWPVLGLAALGLTGLVRVRRTDAAPGLAVVGLLLGVVGLQYLYDPLETGLQMESMRRYVPVVLPLTMLFGALTVVTLLARVAAARYRLGLTLATGALLVGLVARPSLAVVGQPLWDEALAQTAQVARLFPDQAVVLVSPDLAGTHIQTSLAYLHDVDAILVQERNPDDQVLRRVIGAGWRAAAPWSSGAGILVLRAGFRARGVERAHIDLYTLERTRTGPAGRRVHADPAAAIPGSMSRRPTTSCRRARGGRTGCTSTPPAEISGSGSGWSESGCSERPHRRSGWTRPETGDPGPIAIQSTNPRPSAVDPRDLGVRPVRGRSGPRPDRRPMATPSRYHPDERPLEPHRRSRRRRARHVDEMICVCKGNPLCSTLSFCGCVAKAEIGGTHEGCLCDDTWRDGITSGTGVWSEARASGIQPAGRPARSSVDLRATQACLDEGGLTLVWVLAESHRPARLAGVQSRRDLHVCNYSTSNAANGRALRDPAVCFATGGHWSELVAGASTDEAAKRSAPPLDRLLGCVHRMRDQLRFCVRTASEQTKVVR